MASNLNCRLCAYMFCVCKYEMGGSKIELKQLWYESLQYINTNNNQIKETGQEYDNFSKRCEKFTFYMPPSTAIQL